MDASAYKQVVVLRKGASVSLRPIRPDDAPRLITLCHRLSLRTVYQRFFSPRRLRPEEADTFADGDYRERMAVVAEVDTGQELGLIGVARYGPAAEAATADIGLVVEDGWQGLGLGTMLLKDTDMAQSTTSDRVTSVTFRRRENSAGSAVEPSQEVIPNVEALAQYSGRRKGGHGLASTTTEHSQGATGRVSDDARSH